MNDQITQLADTILEQVEKVLEDQLIMQLKKNMPKISVILGKIAKLDIAVGFVGYIRQQTVEMCIPTVIDEESDLTETTLSRQEQRFTKSNLPVIYMKQGFNPLLLQFRSGCGQK